MSRVIALTTKTKKQNKVAIVKQSAAVSEYNPIFPGDIQALLKQQIHPSLIKFLLFWTMMDAIKVHGYSRAAMGAIGRATIGTWWQLTKHEEWGNKATETQRKKLYRFYSYQDRKWDNIKDFQSLAYKLAIGAMYLRFFGQVGYQIIRDGNGVPLGFDHLTGLIVPNVDEFGYFNTPAFIQYPTKNPQTHTEFNSASDIVFITNPDWEGSPLGGSDIEALVEFGLPLDIYLQTAAREYMKHTDRPELIYTLATDTSDEAFDTFVQAIQAKFSGPTKRGRNPIVTAGDMDVKRLDDLPDGLPYQEARDATREEILAVSGLGGAILGLTGSMSSANIRETRRQFHETTMEPLFRILQEGLYSQIHVREYNIPGWVFGFLNPDFMTAVERATIHMRYVGMGVFNPNEVRDGLGYDEREGGDEYVEPRSTVGSNPQGSPPEGHPEEPDSPANTGEPTNDDQDPPRGDQHDDQTERNLIGFMRDVKAWRRFAINRVKRGMNLRRYKTEYIPKNIALLLQKRLQKVQTEDEVKQIFAGVVDAIEEQWRKYNGAISE